MSKWQIIGLLAFCTTMTFGAYFLIVIPGDVRYEDLLFRQWNEMFNHTALAPYRYRLLSIFLEDLLAPNNAFVEIVAADVVLHLLLFPFIYAGLYIWLKAWVGIERAMLGCFIVVAFQPVAFLHYYLSVYTSIELALLVWFLVGLSKRWPYWSLVVLLVVASLNRETSLLLVGVFVAYEFGKSGWIRRSLGLAVVWAVVIGGIHLALGSADHVLGIAGTLNYNIVTLTEAVFYNILFLPLWLLVLLYSRRATVVLRRVSLCVILYIISFVVGGAWQEVRLFTPILPLVLPAVLQLSGKQVSLADRS